MCSFALGDTLLFSSALQGIRAHFPTQQLIFFCGPQNKAAAELLTGIDAMVSINILKPRYTIRRMREQKLDLLLDFSAWQRLTAFYSLLSGARFTAGFRTPGQYRHRGYDRTAPHSPDLHEVDNFRSLLQAMGITERHAPALLPPAVPEPALLARGRQIVVFHLWPSGVRSFLREWPLDRWIALAHELKKLVGSDVLFVITGAPSNLERCEAFCRQIQADGLESEVFIGRDGLGALCQILLHARLVVSVNTGIMHLAAILGAPTISLNGPNRNGRWGPVGSQAVGIESPGTGCGYLHLGFEHGDLTAGCMERISVEMVCTVAADLLAAQPIPK